MPDSYDDWSSERPSPRRGERRGERGLDQRMDQWVSAGRQLVDGVSGARPGGRRPSGLRLDQVGRWVEDKIDWLLEDDDGWRESWEEPSTPQRRRQPLDAISRRGRAVRPAPAPAPVQVQPSAPTPEPLDAEAWPEDESFTLNRWRREAPPRQEERSVEVVEPQPFDAGLGRSLPRSTRRRAR